MAGLGIPTAAASLPPDCQISVVDDNIDAIDYEHEADIVCLSFFTPQATRCLSDCGSVSSEGEDGYCRRDTPNHGSGGYITAF